MSRGVAWPQLVAVSRLDPASLVTSAISVYADPPHLEDPPAIAIQSLGAMAPNLPAVGWSRAGQPQGSHHQSLSTEEPLPSKLPSAGRAGLTSPPEASPKKCKCGARTSCLGTGGPHASLRLSRASARANRRCRSYRHSSLISGPAFVGLKYLLSGLSPMRRDLFEAPLPDLHRYIGIAGGRARDFYDTG
jgi:hypothetical protein